MSVIQIRDRLDQRFRLLTGSRRSIERHQTLRHTVQWSYDLLESFEQAVLQQVSVFAGGFTLPAALAVCGGDGVDEFDMLDALDSLVRKSLMQLDRSDGDVRYEMLETIRQFAEEALVDTGDGDAVRDLHARYFADEADIHDDMMITDQVGVATRWADVEMANLSAAFRWAADRGDVDAAIRIATSRTDSPPPDCGPRRPGGVRRSSKRHDTAGIAELPRCWPRHATAPPERTATTTPSVTGSKPSNSTTTTDTTRPSGPTRGPGSRSALAETSNVA